jgi:peptide/nickel transport system substrate-binding protein
VFLALFGFSVALLAFAVWAPAELAAQKAKKEESEDEDKPKTPAKSPKKVEEEDTEADLDETTPVDLAAEAKSAPAGPIRELYKSLAVPHDDLTMRAGRVDHVVPLNRYLGPDPDFSGTIAPIRVDSSGKRSKLNPISKKDITSVTHYEEIALAEVTAFFDKKVKPRIDSLVACEKSLLFALRFHAKERKGKADHARQWKKMEEGLRVKWIEARRERVAALADANRWDEAFRLADLVARDKENLKLLKSQVDIHLDLPKLAVRKAEKTGKLEDYVAARYRLEAFERTYPARPESEAVRKGLKSRASDLMKQGLELVKTDRSGAIEKLREASKVWPDLDGLQDTLRNLDNEHPVLYVGVAQLPEYMSPALAFSDAEKQAVELLFDGLVKRAPEEGGVWTYRADLALTRPRVIPLGREMLLDPGAKWSDGTPLKAADVQNTVRLLKKEDLQGRNTAWANLMDNPRVEGGGSNQLRITLANGFLDPLSLMTFKILPQKYAKDKVLQRADDLLFAKNPMGSGPFLLEKSEKSGIVFAANPHYQERSGRSGKPRIHEIRMFVSQNPVQDFNANPARLHLLLDLPTTRVKQLIDGGVSPQNIITRATPRVYFLAVNNARETLQNVKLRKAIGHAIDREAILTKFRAGYQGLDSQKLLKTQIGPEDERLHPALNGPYPVGSWAFNPIVRATLYDPQLAKRMAADATKDVAEVTLKLIYPNDDPRAKEACEAICAQVASIGSKIKIDPRGLAPHDFRDHISDRKYELAYCHHDYTSDAYWLWPLFDPHRKSQQPGGSNFLRYENDDQLASLFGLATNRRDFAEIKKVTHEIHAHIYDKMPLIPLWQLHTHIAVHPQLKTGELDPLLVFTNVEDWKLQK